MSEKSAWLIWKAINKSQIKKCQVKREIINLSKANKNYSKGQKLQKQLKIKFLRNINQKIWSKTVFHKEDRSLQQ